jgi:uncharacterized integral membrane protein|tara:strand:+ start:19 stop:348 length:330 start_codon:yes stop_codon:yes gene_type:complete
VLKAIYWILTLPLGAVIIVFSLNNRVNVVLDLWPLDFLAFPIPLFSVALASVVLGFIIGSLIFWKSLLITRRQVLAEARRADKAEKKLLVNEEFLNDLRKSTMEAKDFD